jgi:glycosyltransferase involved in cell wall biosynthesis
MDFSILIPTLNSRRSLFQQVYSEIKRQISEITMARIEVLYESDNGELTLGAKRNLLVSRAQGKYHCFIDDDDVVSPTFLKSFLPMLEDDYDCSSYVGAYYKKGEFKKLFYHSLDIREWSETDDCYLRCPSPLNMIRTDIVRQVQYKDIRNTEDYEFSMRLLDSGLLKKEYKIPYTAIYHYIDGVKENRDQWLYTWNNDYTRLNLFLKPSQLPPNVSKKGQLCWNRSH